MDDKARSYLKKFKYDFGPEQRYPHISTFVWRNTPEGQDYWFDLNHNKEKLRQELNKPSFQRRVCELTLNSLLNYATFRNEYNVEGVTPEEFMALIGYPSPFDLEKITESLWD